MTLENPFSKRPSKQEQETAQQEISSMQIESAESRLDTSATRLKEAMAEPVDEEKVKDPDTWEKIQESWSNAKLRAMEAFTALFVAEGGAFVWLGETYKAAHTPGTAFGVDYAELLQRVDQLQTTNTALIAAALAVPAIMLGLSKLSHMRREENLYKPTDS